MTRDLTELMKEQGQTRATVLLQGYPYTGFGLIDIEKGIHLPFSDVSLRKDLYWDIRMFSREGEWHLWKKDAKGEWGKRFANPRTWASHIERLYRLCGGTMPRRDRDWFRYEEANGATVYLPDEMVNPALKIHLRIERDLTGTGQHATHLAGIVDAMISEIVEVSNAPIS